MSTKTIKVELTEQELETMISALLFSCSVNVTSNTDEEFQTELFEVAKKLKNLKTDIQLNNIQFLQEDNYEDAISSNLFDEFKTNIKVTKFDLV
jgi:hypothetical protein